MMDGRDIETGTTEQVSSYLRYLPAPLQDGRFIGQFLRAFEAMLSGGVLNVEKNDDASSAIGAQKRPQAVAAQLLERDAPERWQGLSETLNEITRYFQPHETPDDFLPWLARWVAVDLRDDWSVPTRRNVIASIVPLYKLRGTCAGIKQAVGLCMREVIETASVDIKDRVEENGRTCPYYFEVTLTVNVIQGPGTIQQLQRKAEAAIELQKPAHTYYHLALNYPSLILLDEDPHERPKTRATKGVYVGRNTTLGSAKMGPRGEKLPLSNPLASDR